jgi:hypothetical protein
MHCDYHGTCKRIPYAEVFPMNGKWSYLCKEHYHQEREKHGEEYSWYILSPYERIITYLKKEGI